MVRQASKRVGDGSLFSIPTENTRAYSLPTDKKPETLSQVNVGAVPKNVFANIYYFILLCEELIPGICPVF